MTAQSDDRPAGGLRGDDDTRTCPFCQASIASVSILCPQCDRFSKPIVPAELNTRPKEALIPRANAAIARWESDPQIERRLGLVFAPLNLSIPGSVRLGVAAVLLLLGAAMSLLWLRYGGWEQAQGVFALLVTGGSLLFANRLLRPNREPVVGPYETPTNSFSIRLFGYDFNPALAQATALAAMVYFILQYDIDMAWNCALLTLAFAPLLWRTRHITFTITAGVLALLYIAYVWAVYDFYYLTVSNDKALHVSWTLTPIAAYLWTLIAIALVPQLQLLSVRKVGLGCFKGDTSTWILGCKVPIAITSSVILVSAVLAVEALLYSPWWVPTALFG